MLARLSMQTYLAASKVDQGAANGLQQACCHVLLGSHSERTFLAASKVKSGAAK